jgi:hypothetical protein
VNRPTAERIDRLNQLTRRPAVVDRDASPGIGEESGKGDAASGQPQDRN